MTGFSDFVFELEEILGKPLNVGPLGVAAEYTIEPIRGEESEVAEPTEPADRRRLRN